MRITEPTFYNFYSLFLIVLISTSINAQSFDTELSRIDFISNYVEQPRIKNRTHYMDTKVDFDLYLTAVQNSGKLIIGGQQIDYLNSIVKNLGTDQSQKTTCIVRSKEVGTFSTDSVIYLTSGLIAQLQNSHQLAFFLARELSSKKQSQFWEGKHKNNFIASSYDGKIKTLVHRTLLEEIDLDRKGLELIKSKKYYFDQALQSLEVLKYAHIPFEIIDVAEDYLNSDEYFVPPSYFKVSKSMKLRIIDSSQNTSIFKRIQSLGSDIKTIRPFNENSPDFNNLSRAARFDYLDESISNGEFELAIYIIYVLENRYDAIELLKEKKAISWYGLALREMKVTPPKDSKYYQHLSNSGVHFLLTIRKLPTAAKLSIALRTVGNLRNQGNSNMQLWKNLLFHISKYPFINIREFSSINYYETFRGHNDSILPLENSKYNKIQSIEKQKIIDKEQDSSKFYLYGLADYVRDSSFWTQIKALKIYPIDSNSTFTITPSVSYTKKRRPKLTKSNQALLELNKELESYASVKKVLNFNDIDLLGQNSIRWGFSQQYCQSKYGEVTPSKIEFNQRELFNEESDYLVFPLFQSTFRLRLKSAYFTGFFVVTIPFIISDLFLKSFQSSYSVLVVDSKTNEVVYSEYVAYNEPLTTKNMLERISNSINQITLIR